jgi:hypothetical protein
LSIVDGDHAAARTTPREHSDRRDRCRADACHGNRGPVLPGLTALQLPDPGRDPNVVSRADRGSHTMIHRLPRCPPAPRRHWHPRGRRVFDSHNGVTHYYPSKRSGSSTLQVRSAFRPSFGSQDTSANGRDILRPTRLD